MNADAFRDLYAYHFAANRKVWDEYVLPLTQEQFVQPVPYSIGSIRNHIVDLMSVDDSWFAGLRGVDEPGFLNPVRFASREKIRIHWDSIEQTMQDYLCKLEDSDLITQPFLERDEDPIYVWQVLFHVINRGTDHRAQMLRILHDLGMETDAQDYVFYSQGDCELMSA